MGRACLGGVDSGAPGGPHGLADGQRAPHLWMVNDVTGDGVAGQSHNTPAWDRVL